MRTRDLKRGMQFNRLTAVDFAYRTPKACYWIWMCKCGVKTAQPTVAVFKGGIKSCGCLQREYMHSSDRSGNCLPKGHAARNALLNSYKMNAKKRGHAFELNLDQFKQLTKSACYFCGVKPKQRVGSFASLKRNGDYVYNGLDRLNNLKGYSIENTVACCGICNTAKNDLKLSEFTKWMDRLVKHRTLVKSLNKEKQ